MNRKEYLPGVWLMSMTLLSLCSYTVFYVAKMLPRIFVLVYLLLTVLQVTALVIYMWGPEKLTSKILKVLYRIVYASSFLVLPSFMLQFMGLVSQYHAEIPDSIDAVSMPVEEILPRDETVVYYTGMAYVIFPEYSDIDFVCGDRPSQADDSISWCSGAAIHHSISLSFDPEDIEEDYAIDGTFYKSPHNMENYSAFVFANGHYGV